LLLPLNTLVVEKTFVQTFFTEQRQKEQSSKQLACDDLIYKYIQCLDLFCSVHGFDMCVSVLGGGVVFVVDIKRYKNHVIKWRERFLLNRG